MQLPVKITNIEAVEAVTYRDGSQHRCQNVWINYNNTLDDGTSESWYSFLTLWDEKIDEFQQVGHQPEDYILVSITPSYSKREWQGRTIYNREMRIVWQV